MHDACNAEERWYAKSRDLNRKFRASEDAYLDLIGRYGPLLTKKERLENNIEALKSSVEELTYAINQ